MYQASIGGVGKSGKSFHPDGWLPTDKAGACLLFCHVLLVLLWFWACFASGYDEVPVVPFSNLLVVYILRRQAYISSVCCHY
jgi:hypothetical protein